MLNKMSETIRGNLSKLQRLKYVALVTIQVHERDVVDKLIKNNCMDVTAFEWLSQLRLYWDKVCRQKFYNFIISFQICFALNANRFSFSEVLSYD